jgi:hypothetical protein
MTSRRVPRLLVVLAVFTAGCAGTADDGSTSSDSRSQAAPSTAATPSPPGVELVGTDPVAPPSLDELASESVSAVVFASSGIDIDAGAVGAAEEVEADLLAKASALAQPGPEGFRRPAQGIATGSGMLGLGVIIELVGKLTGTIGKPFSDSVSSTTTNGSGTLGMEAKLSGDGTGSTTVDIAMESTVQTDDGRTATQRIRGSLSGPRCPDASGLLELEATGSMEVTVDSSPPVRSRHQFTGPMRLQFDDNADLADVQMELDVQSDRTDSNGRSAFVDVAYSLAIANPLDDGSAYTKNTADVKRTSQATQSDPQQADRDMVDQGAQAAVKFLVSLAGKRAALVQNNECVIVVAEGPTTVGARQVVPIEVKTKHVIEGTDLDKRVEASLSGDGELEPTSLAKTPDTVTYTAGDEGGDTGTITLVSTSRQGKGTTTLTLKVADKYRVDAPAGVLRIQGQVCSLDAPFTLSVVGEINGSLTFTPSGSGGGTYSGSADLGSGSMDWSGGYTVANRDPDAPSIDADEGTTVLNPVGPIPSFWAGSGPDFPLIPDATACS